MRTLYVFDVDNTLFFSDAKIGVYLDGKFQHHLKGSKAYHAHKKTAQEGHTYDFREYTSSDIFKAQARPILHIIEQAKKAIANPLADVVILTARNSMDSFETFKSVFDEHGMNSTNLQFEFSGDVRDIYGRDNMTSQQAKKYIVDSYICGFRYGRVVVYDDLKENIDMILSLRYDYPTFEFKGYLVEVDNASFNANTGHIK